MKRPIKSFADVEYIIKYKCDVCDTQGFEFPFLNLTLVELMNDVFPNAWTYFTED